MFRAKRQGIELSVNAIIIMALALIILLIGALWIIKSAGQANNATSCESQDDAQCQAKCNDEFPVPSPFTCSKKGEICCSNIGGLSPTTPK